MVVTIFRAKDGEEARLARDQRLSPVVAEMRRFGDEAIERVEMEHYNQRKAVEYIRAHRVD